MRNTDDAWTRLVLVLQELGIVERVPPVWRRRCLRTW